MERRPVVIVGSGPAGAATALFLHRLDPALAGECVVLEKARHPREKVCAGGLIPHAVACLDELDVPVRVPYALVRHGRVAVPGRTVAYEADELCRVVRRDQFDRLLVDACRERGIAVREDTKVVALHRGGDAVRVEAAEATYDAGVVVGADGSGSIVRRELVAGGRQCIGKAVMRDVPLATIDWTGFAEQRYDFDFTAVPDGLRGYVWAFPCVIGGRAHVNVGVYSRDAQHSGPQLVRLLHRAVQRLGVLPGAHKAFPIRWYGRGVRVAAPRALLVGDAAGVDPLMGEGISFALEYGRHAAQALVAARRGGAYDFDEYSRMVTEGWVGRKLRRLERAARLFYGRTWRVWFALAACSPRAREIGVRWYNGVDGWDRSSALDAVRAWCAADPEQHDRSCR